jgi:hypothetical protein
LRKRKTRDKKDQKKQKKKSKHQMEVSFAYFTWRGNEKENNRVEFKANINKLVPCFFKHLMEVFFVKGKAGVRKFFLHFAWDPVVVRKLVRDIDMGGAHVDTGGKRQVQN